MSRLILVFLIGTYLALSGALSFTLYRGASEPGTCIAAFIGAMAIFLAIHALVISSLDSNRLGRDLELIRDAHRLMVEAIDATQKDMIDLADQVQTAVLIGLTN